MAVTASDIPRALVERVEAAHPASAIFGADEIAEWPDGVLESLLKVGLLQETQRASTVICDGCDWRCVKPVVVRKKSSGGAGKAFVTCDEEPDFGRIAVSLERLAQYRSTIGAMSGFLGHALDISLQAKVEHAASIRLGSIKGRYGDRAISIVLHNRGLELRVGRQHEALAGCLRWDNARIHIDRARVHRLANRKEHSTSQADRYQPDRSAQQEKKRATAREDQKIIRQARCRHQETGDSWTLIAAQIAKTALAFRKSGRRLSAGRIRRIICQERER